MPMKLLNLRFLSLPLLLAALTSGCNSGPSKAELDAEVRRLCAIDGGVTVYETVALPPEMFNEWGQPLRSVLSEKADQAAPYYIEREVTWLREGLPSLRKDKHLIIRRSDGRILGEAVSYARRGVDLPGPWHESSFRCPKPSDGPGVTRLVFAREGAGK